MTKIKVLHIGNELSWRGGENQIRLLISGLRPFGVESFIAYPKASRAFTRFSELRGPHGPVDVLGLPSRRAFDPRNIRALIHWCDENEIQILDAHSSAAMSMALKVKKRRPKLQLVVHRRVDNPIKRRFVTKRKYLSPLIGRFVCISNAISRIVTDYGVDPKRISVVRSAVEETPYRQPIKGAIDSANGDKLAAKQLMVGHSVPFDIPWIGNASAFTQQKGHETLIQACGILRDRSMRFICWLAGDGPLLEQSKRLVDDLNLSNEMRFVGHIPSVTNFILSLDVLAVPSNNEGLGTILLEGAHAGCALVGSNVGGIPEIIRNGETGFLVEPGQAKDLAARLEELIKSSALRERFVAASRAHVRANFSVEQMVRGNLEVYKELMR